MSDHDKDLKLRISMLLDGELEGRDNPRLIERLENDALLKQAWARYNLIGQALRSPPGSLFADAEFALRVGDAIADEPAILAPRGPAALNPERRQRVIGFALAASLTVVAVLVGKSVVDHGGELYAKAIAGPTVASSAGNNTDKLADAQFNDYLLSHNETASLAGSAGMLLYVRSVSAGVDR